MATCKIYKGSTLLGSGTVTNDTDQVTSFTAQSGAVLSRRNVMISVTSSTHIGESFRARVVVDNGAGTLTLDKKYHFAT